MRRIIAVLSVMAIMVAMLVVMAMPAFAQGPPPGAIHIGAQQQACFNSDFKAFGPHSTDGAFCSRYVQ